MTEISKILEHIPANLFNADRLNRIAKISDVRGDVAFTPGGGILFDTPASKEERAATALRAIAQPRLLSLPEDRFNVALASNPGFREFVDAFTVQHARAGYRLVVIPLLGRLTPQQLRTIAYCAQAFGHDEVRITAGVSIRLPNVPNALLRPLYKALGEAGLLVSKRAPKAA